jgi:hypothetical protein
MTDASTNQQQSSERSTPSWIRYLPEAYGIRQSIEDSPFRWCVRESAMWGIATGTAMGLWVRMMNRSLFSPLWLLLFDFCLDQVWSVHAIDLLHSWMGTLYVLLWCSFHTREPKKLRAIFNLHRSSSRKVLCWEVYLLASQTPVSCFCAVEVCFVKTQRGGFTSNDSKC